MLLLQPPIPKVLANTDTLLSPTTLPSGSDQDDDEGVPTYVQWRTKCLGIESVGLPAGSLYFNAKIVRDGDRCTLEAGRLTVKEEIGVNTPLFPTARGILAEFKIVGTFEARPRAAVAAPSS